MRTFVIGDCHGHLDRLEALLLAEEIIGRCEPCDGMGEIRLADPKIDEEDAWNECENCRGDGIARIDDDTMVVQLGDLGHFGDNGSPTGDMLCWRAAHNGWIDVVLWGNHDRALVDKAHIFNHYQTPDTATLHYVKSMYNQGRVQLAFESHGHLLTHAGLHKSFKHQKIDPELKTDVIKFVDWINDEDDRFLARVKCDKEAMAIRDCIGSKRGGRADHGGILWRDSNESLFAGWPQVFGHTKGELIRTYNNDSYCIDLGFPDNGRLAGMWLPEREFVQIETRRNPEDNSPLVERFPA